MSKELETEVPEFSSACYGVAASETHDRVQPVSIPQLQGGRLEDDQIGSTISNHQRSAREHSDEL